MKFKYYEVPMDSIVEENSTDSGNSLLKFKRNRIFLDIGNKLQVGVIDHHQRNDAVLSNKRELRCVTTLVIKHPDLITKNVDNDAEEVEIVSHYAPDFDCYAASFLIEKLVTENNFGFSDDTINRFCAYTEKVDCGMLKIIPDNLEEIHAVGFAIYNCEKQKRDLLIEELKEKKQSEIKSIKDLMENHLDSDKYKKQIDEITNEYEKKIKSELVKSKKNMRKSWFKLLEKSLIWLENNPCKDLEHSNIFIGSNDFKDEIEFVKEDFKRYQHIKDQNKYFDEVRVMLPKMYDASKKLYPVKGVATLFIYNKKFDVNEFVDGIYLTNDEKYNVVLLKFWIRNEDYIFTICPKYIKKSFISKLSQIEFKTGEEIDIELSRVIIAVDPNSGYSLRGLADQIEDEERNFEYYLKENCLVDGEPFYKREYDDAEKRRYSYDPSCTNDDPWFDGRNFQYTIIDSPRGGSLLSYKKIKEIALNHSFLNISISNCIIKVVIPFEFTGKFDKFKSLFKDNFCLKHHLCEGVDLCSNKEDFCPEDRKDYFLRYLSDYLYADIKEKNESFHLHFNEEGTNNRNGLIAFYYGTGCFYFSINIEKEKYSSNLRLVKLITELKNIKKSFSNEEVVLNRLMEYLKADKNEADLFKSLEDSITNISSPKFYYSVTAQDNGFIEANEKLLLYQMAYLRLLKDNEINDVILERIKDKLIMKVGQNSSYAFSKNCGVMLYVDFKNLEGSHNKRYEKFITNFNQNYFDIFLLAIHQRYTLLYLEGQLAKNDKKKMFGNLNMIRRKIMNFTTQGWFNQVTEDEIGQEVYEKWQDILECKAHYEELTGQVESVDSYKSSSTTRFVEIISFIFFPLLFITQILGCEFINIKPIGPEEGFGLLFVISSSLISVGLFFGMYFLLKAWESKN